MMKGSRPIVLVCLAALVGCSNTQSVNLPGELENQRAPALGVSEEPSKTPLAEQTLSQDSDPCCCAEPDKSLARRDQCDYIVPDVVLVNQDGKRTSSGELFEHEGPIVVQFFFTSCSTLCPVLTSSLSTMQSEFKEEVNDARFISISIDPHNDTPAKLKEFSENFDPSSEWYFVTGEPEDIHNIQKAFDAYQQNKMQHLPLTFIRPTKTAKWTRLDGLVGAKRLGNEFTKTVEMASR